MTSKLINNVLMPGKYNNYLIAGNITNAFAIGEIGSLNDFFIVASEPNDESLYPMITGNFLDSEGNVLFRLVRNILVMNPGNCSKILGDHIGYEIHDSAGHLIFKVETKFEAHPAIGEECFLTTISVNCFDKNGEIVFKANTGEENEFIESNTKSVFGYSGAFGIIQGYNQEELEFISYIFGSNGRINQPLRGVIENKEINLDGKALQNATIKNCKIHLHKGDFVFIGSNNNIDRCEFVFHNQAKQMFDIINLLDAR